MSNVYLVKFKRNGSPDPLAVLGVFSSKRAADAEMAKLGFEYFTALYTLPLNKAIVDRTGQVLN